MESVRTGNDANRGRGAKDSMYNVKGLNCAVLKNVVRLGVKEKNRKDNNYGAVFGTEMNVMCAAKPKNLKQLPESGTQLVHVHCTRSSTVQKGEEKKNGSRNRSREINSSQFDSHSHSLCLSFSTFFCLQRFSFPSLVFVFKTLNFLIILSMNKAYSGECVVYSYSYFSLDRLHVVFFGIYT